MEKIAKFEKVSFKQFKADFIDCFPTYNDDEIKEIYDNITLPVRATTYSAGYDFVCPIDLKLEPGKTQKVPTGIRCNIKGYYFLAIFPRSGLGFKYRMQLDNSVGIIDADYYNALNEGHIMAKVTNDTHDNKTLEVAKGKGFVQGIFIPFGVTIDDDVNTLRVGGFGSTTK